MGDPGPDGPSSPSRDYQGEPTPPRSLGEPALWALPLTSMRLVILWPGFWETLKGAETGQDDESQGEKQDLGGSKEVLGLWGQWKGSEGRVHRGVMRGDGFCLGGRGTEVAGDGGGGGETDWY